MDIMKIFGKIAIIGLLATVPLGAAEPTKAEFDDVVDFGLTLQHIADNPSTAVDRAVVVDGNIAWIVPLEGEEPAGGAFRLGLVNGVWIGLERIEIYRAIVEVRGSQLGARFASSGASGDEVLKVNSRILVAGRVSGVDSGERTAIIEAWYIRSLD